MKKKVHLLQLISEKNKTQLLSDEQLDRLKGGASPWLEEE